MAQRVAISYINKSARYNPYERIVNVGGRNPNGTRWKMSHSEAIRSIETGTSSFYVDEGGWSVNVIIATSRYGHKYLKTVADGEQPESLLRLPECSY